MLFLINCNSSFLFISIWNKYKAIKLWIMFSLSWYMKCVIYFNCVLIIFDDLFGANHYRSNDIYWNKNICNCIQNILKILMILWMKFKMFEFFLNSNFKFVSIFYRKILKLFKLKKSFCGSIKKSSNKEFQW